MTELVYKNGDFIMIKIAELKKVFDKKIVKKLIVKIGAQAIRLIKEDSIAKNQEIKINSEELLSGIRLVKELEGVNNYLKDSPPHVHFKILIRQDIEYSKGVKRYVVDYFMGAGWDLVEFRQAVKIDNSLGEKYVFFSKRK